MRRKTVKSSFYQSWLNFITRPDPSVFEDEISFFYQGCFIKSFLIIVMDGGRFEMPLPKIIWAKGYDASNRHDKIVGLSNPVVKEPSYPLDNHPVEKIVLTEVEMKLSNILSNRGYGDYFQILRRYNKLEITTISTK
jgi:hypothetical protein